MDTQQNPNQPNKPTSPGQGGQQDREREERERQRREQEKQGGGKQGGGQAKADDKTGSLGTSERREVTPAAFLFTSKLLLKAKPFCYARRRSN